MTVIPKPTQQDQQARSAHTPVPYGLYGENVIVKDCVKDAVGYKFTRIADVIEADDAKFIVHACNSHYDMLEALKVARDSIASLGSSIHLTAHEKRTVASELELIDAALAKATGAQS